MLHFPFLVCSQFACTGFTAHFSNRLEPPGTGGTGSSARIGIIKNRFLKTGIVGPLGGRV